ncbi:MAG: SBBP repeat-containing protein [Bacteroidota bacterium]|nr:SBBP repeat-containing protein [Bacteroidota bacterium]
MKKLLLSICCLVAVFLANAQPTFWAKSMGGNNTDYGTSITVDAAGNVYTVGTFLDSVDFDPGVGVYKLVSTYTGSPFTVGNDVFISKLDASGNFVWAKSMGGNVADFGWSVAVDAAGNVYTVGNFKGLADFDPGAGTYNLASKGSWDVFISKLNASGNFVWAKTLGGTNFEAALSVTVDASGNVYTTGNFNGTADFNPADTLDYFMTAASGDIFISKLDSSGKFVWAKKLGGTGDDGGNSIHIDAWGNIYTTGYFQYTGDFDPGTGLVSLIAEGDYDIFISKLDPAGNFKWAKQIGGIAFDEGGELTSDASGNLYVCGNYNGTVDLDPGAGVFNLNNDLNFGFTLKLDSSGNFAWAKSIGNGCIALDASRNVYVTSSFQGTADFDPGTGTYNLTSSGSDDIYIAKLDASGNIVWATHMGGTLSDWGRDIAVDASGNVYTLGWFNDIANLDPRAGIFNLTSKGKSDIFVHKMNQTKVGIKENMNPGNMDYVTIYPNPSNGIINVALLYPKNTIRFEIYNSIGELVYKQERISELNTIDMKTVSNGLYFVKITDNENKISTTKFLKTD